MILLHLTSIDKAYLAGIIDGEGSIMLTSFNKLKLPAPSVSISSTSLELLEWIKFKVGTGVISSKKNYNPDKHQDAYSYAIRYNSALELIFEIEPYLQIREKKQRAKLILSNYKKITVRNGRYTPDQLKAKDEFLKTFYEI